MYLHSLLLSLSLFSIAFAAPKGTKTEAVAAVKTVHPTAKPIKSTGKRGLAYNDPALTDYFSLQGQDSVVTWTFNWASDPYYGGDYTPKSYNDILVYHPQLSSDVEALTSIWSANVKNAIAKYGTKSILAFNEPDVCFSGCACMNVSAAVSAYKQHMQPFSGKVLLGAPAVTNAVGPGVGTDWLQKFMGACTSCTIDFIPFHWYGSATDPTSFKTYVKAFYAEFKKPLWITEFGTNGGTDAEIIAFLKDVMPWLDKQDYMVHYAYFMNRAAGSPYLLNPDATLTNIGQVYNSYT